MAAKAFFDHGTNVITRNACIEVYPQSVLHPAFPSPWSLGVRKTEEALKIKGGGRRTQRQNRRSGFLKFTSTMKTSRSATETKLTASW